jgi:alkylhydroperoxidase/carboxymuconolactone decarboxylase family protein YurZ
VCSRAAAPGGAPPLPSVTATVEPDGVAKNGAMDMLAVGMLRGTDRRGPTAASGSVHEVPERGAGKCPVSRSGAGERTIVMARPPFMVAMEENDPELAKRVDALRQWAEKDGALSGKVKVLMGLFADALLGHADGVKSIAERARAMGASEEEINETVHMAFLFGGLPGLVTATSAFRRKG